MRLSQSLESCRVVVGAGRGWGRGGKKKKTYSAPSGWRLKITARPSFKWRGLAGLRLRKSHSCTWVPKTRKNRMRFCRCGGREQPRLDLSWVWAGRGRWGSGEYPKLIRFSQHQQEKLNNQM